MGSQPLQLTGALGALSPQQQLSQYTRPSSCSCSQHRRRQEREEQEAAALPWKQSCGCAVQLLPALPSMSSAWPLHFVLVINSVLELPCGYQQTWTNTQSQRRPSPRPQTAGARQAGQAHACCPAAPGWPMGDSGTAVQSQHHPWASGMLRGSAAGQLLRFPVPACSLVHDTGLASCLLSLQKNLNHRKRKPVFALARAATAPYRADFLLSLCLCTSLKQKRLQRRRGRSWCSPPCSQPGPPWPSTVHASP